MVSKIPAMVDMALDQEEKAEVSNPSPPKYPWGLSICLCQDELDKLNIDSEDVAIGDLLHMHSLAKVTSISSNETEDGGLKTSIQLQVIAISAEDEEEEDAEAEPEMKRTSKFYK